MKMTDDDRQIWRDVIKVDIDINYAIAADIIHAQSPCECMKSI